MDKASILLKSIVYNYKKLSIRYKYDIMIFSENGSTYYIDNNNNNTKLTYILIQDNYYFRLSVVMSPCGREDYRHRPSKSNNGCAIHSTDTYIMIPKYFRISDFEMPNNQVIIQCWDLENYTQVGFGMILHKDKIFQNAEKEGRGLCADELEKILYIIAIERPLEYLRNIIMLNKSIQLMNI